MESDSLEKSKDPSYLTLLKNLKKGDGEFYLTILIKFALQMPFTFVSYLLSIYYIEVWDLSDITAGFLTTINSSQIFFIFLIGGVVDYLGIRDSYRLVSILGIICFLLLALIENLPLNVIIIGLGTSAIAVISFSSLKAAVILSTDHTTRSFAFGLYNSSNYLSTILGGIISQVVFAIQGENMDGFRTIFYFSIGFYVFALILSFFSKLNKNWRSSNKVIIQTPTSVIRGVINEKRFWRLTAFLSINAIPVGVLMQVGFILPIYMDRELGETTGYYVFIILYSISTIVLSPVLSPITYYFSSYDSVVIGGFLIGLAPLFFVFGNSYVIITFYTIFTAIGGSVLEPRIYDYNGSVAVPGKEGTYFGLLGFTYSLAYFVTGLVGGVLLEEYCPDNGNRDCWIMWTWNSIIAFCGAGVLFFGKKWLEQPQSFQESDPYIFSSRMN